MTSWQRVDLTADEYARPTEPPITCGLIYRGKRHAISGPPESAKTLTALICGLEHMRAGHGPFALVDFEAGEHATRLMLEDLGASRQEIAAVYYVAPDGPPDERDIEAIVAAGVTLVIIDAVAGAYDVSGLDDNKRADAERFARSWVQPLWKRDVASILLDHVTKNAEGRGKFAIGSERKIGQADVHLGLHAVKQLHRGADGLVRITTHKDRPAHLARPHAAELDLHSDPDTHRISWTFRPANEDGPATEWKPTALMEKVSRYLELKSDPVSRSQIARDVTGKREYLLAAIDHLVTDGHAAETDGARNARLVLSTSPYRADNAPVPDPFPTRSQERDDAPVPGSPPLRGNGRTGRQVDENESHPFPDEHGRENETVPDVAEPWKGAGTAS